MNWRTAMRLFYAIGSTCAIALMFGAAVMSGQTRPASKAPASGPLIDSARPIMQAEEVTLKGVTPIFGDPSKTGTYIIRTRLTANQEDGRIRRSGPIHHGPERHAVDRQRRRVQPDKLLPIREGGVAYLPANTHYFQVAGDSEVILQRNYRQRAGEIRAHRTGCQGPGRRRRRAVSERSVHPAQKGLRRSGFADAGARWNRWSARRPRRKQRQRRRQQRRRNRSTLSAEAQSRVSASPRQCSSAYGANHLTNQSSATSSATGVKTCPEWGCRYKPSLS